VFLKNATYWFYWKKSQKSGTGGLHFFSFLRTGGETEKLFSSPVSF
jgi:hypothetical protein